MSARHLLRLSPNAQSAWVDISNRIETALLPGGMFCQHTDYGSKVAEMIARTAGVFHAFEGHEGDDISLETLQAATQVVLWYASEFVRLFSPPGPLAELNRDAIKLDAWLLESVKEKGMPNFLEKNFLRQYGPHSLRQRDRLTWALDYLQSKDRVRVQQYVSANGRTRRTIVILNDAYYGDLARGLPPQGFPSLE
ncbi:MAG: DUF3987 domain-containing protein [Rhodocyclaceae bacterium]